MKRVLSLLLALAMLVSGLPVEVLASMTETTAPTQAVVETTAAEETTIPETTESLETEPTEPTATDPSVPETTTETEATVPETTEATEQTEPAEEAAVMLMTADDGITSISILGDSISTFAGVSNNTSYNSTIGNNAVYYSSGTLGVTRADTWWQKTIDAMGLKLLVNNSWSGSTVFPPRKGAESVGYGSRCVNLHNDATGEEPDIIAAFIAANDFSYYQDTLGDADIDYAALITENADGSFTYATPVDTCEAYAIMLHKMQQRYPNAEIYCMTPTARRDPDKEDNYADVGQPTAFNAELKKIIQHFGCKLVDLETCGIDKEAEVFDTYMGDGRTHPNAAGMDLIAEALASVMLDRKTQIHDISLNLTNVTAGGNTKAVLSGGARTVKLTANEGYEKLTVTVTMGGEDITASVYADGTVTIPAVTGDVVITASAVTAPRDPMDFRWEFNGTDLANVTADGNAANMLTRKGGTVANGVLSNVYYQMSRSVILRHDLPWVVQWECEGDWSGLLLSAESASNQEGNSYLFRTYNASKLLAFGERLNGQSDNYGIALAGSGIDPAARHTYRIENRIAADGSNMAWLLVDGVELGAMNNYYISGTNDQNKTVNWLNGRDFIFSYVGASSHALNNLSIKYLQIWENGEPEDKNLSGKTLSILGASISTFAGTSNGAAADTTNSTIRNNVKYYPNTTIPEVGLNDTWWMQVAEDLGLRLLVNNAWSGSAILLERSGTVGAYVDRCVQLHDNTGDNAGEEPDIICIQMGFNDFSYGKATLGDANINYASLITADGYGTPATTMEATAIMLDKITKRYPDAEVYMFNHFPRIGQSASDTSLMESLNASIETVCSRFGVTVVDLYTTLTDPDHIGDGKLHPNRLGMDVISEAVKTAIVANTGYEVTTHTVSFALDGVTADYGTDKTVVHGDSFAAKLSAAGYEDLSVTVTMGAQDITASVCSGGSISIPSVTGDVVITARSVHIPRSYRWEFNGTDLAGDNTLTKTAGTTDGGVFKTTRYDLAAPVVLSHERDWAVEWRCQGTWKNSSGSGGRMFTTTPVNADYNARYIFKSNTRGILAMGEKTTTGSHNYGIALADHGIDWTALHTYRLENRIAEDGSNMIWLLVDGKEIGPMTHYFVGTTDKNTTSNWLSGKDFVFPHMGTDTHGFNDCSIDYIQVWEANAPRDLYTGPDFSGKVISIMGDSISTFAGYIPTADGFNLEHLARYPQDNLLTDVNETWWMQVIAELDGKLGINDSWRGATLSGGAPVTTGTTGENAAMSNLVRIQNLGANGIPDIILLYGGTNDLAHVSKVGSFSSASAPAAVDLTTAKWDNLADGFVHTLLRMRHYYPDAQIVALLPTYTASYYTNAKLAEANAVMTQICQHYGIPYTDLRECGITTANLPDGIHPDAAGMDYITDAVVDVIRTQCAVEEGEHIVYPISHDLSNAGASKHYYKGLSAGKEFTETVSGDNLTVTVTMGGVDITADVYKNGTIRIPKVTGAVAVTAKAAFTLGDRLAQLPEEVCAGVNLWTVLAHDKEYYTESGWGVHSSGKVYSVTIPVKAGDRLWATSFQSGSLNGSGSVDGIRVTYFSKDGMLRSLTSTEVYNELTQNGYLTVPEQANAVNIPMWTNQDSNELYLLNVEHSYENGVCTICGEQEEAAETLSLKYDDHYDISGKSVEIVDAGKPTSYQVGYGVSEGTLDTAVVTVEGDHLVATGIGTAKVRIDGQLYEVTVEKAKINLVVLMGQSNAGNHFENATSDVTCPVGTAYWWGNGKGTAATEPVPYTQPSKGFHTPLLAELYAQSVAAGDPVKNVMIWHEGITSKNGQSIVKWAASGENTRGTDATVTMIENCRAYYAKHTDKYEIVDSCVYWLQGESDTEMDPAQYTQCFMAMWERLKAAGMEHLAFLRLRWGVNGNGEDHQDLHHSASLSAQIRMINKNPEFYMATDLTENWVGTADISHTVDISNYITMMQAYSGSATHTDAYGNNATYADGKLTTTMKTLYGSNNKCHYGKFGYGLIGADAAYNMYRALHEKNVEIVVTDTSGHASRAQHLKSGVEVTIDTTDMTDNLSFRAACGSTAGTLKFTVKSEEADITEGVIVATGLLYNSVSVEAMRNYKDVSIDVVYTTSEGTVHSVTCSIYDDNQESAETLSLKYDDHYDISGKSVEIVDAGNAVVTLEDGYLVATGIGSARVKIDGADYTITVEKAKINLVMIVGQSNSGNHFPNATSDVTCPPGTAYHWGYGATEPTDYTQPSMGFHAPLLAELYAQSVAAGDPVKNVLLWEEGYTSKNGQSVTAWAVEQNGSISTAGTDGAAQMVRDCLAYYKQRSDKFEIVNKVVFCNHGSTDHSMETQRYIRLFTAMWERLKAEGMEYVAFLRVRGAHSLYTPENADTYYNAASSAQFEMVRTREDMFMATTLAEAWTGPVSTVHSIDIRNYITVMEAYGQAAEYSDSYGNKASYANGVLTTTMKELYGSNNKIHYGKFGYGLIGADAAYNMYAALNGTRAATITQTDSSGLKSAERISAMGSTQTINIEELTYNLSFYPTCGSPKGTMQIRVMAGDVDITENVVSKETATFGTISTEALRNYIKPAITVSYTHGGKTEAVTYELAFEHPCNDGHRYESVVTKPTCTEKGYTTHTCIACGDSYVDSEVPATGVHSYECRVTFPKNTVKGHTDYVCTVCDDTYQTAWLDPAAYEGKTLAAIGDSITAGVGVTADQTDYVYLLARQLGMGYIRLGASGTTLCTDGHRTCNIGKLTESNLAGADVITIFMGINDFCNAQNDYYTLGDITSTDSSTIYGAVRMWCEKIQQLRQTDSLADTQFYFLTPLITSWNNSVSSSRDWDQSKTNIHGYTLRDLCNAIIAVCAQYDVPVIDLNLTSGLYYVSAQDNNTATFGGDGVHPGAAGHEKMTDALADALLQNELRNDHTHAYGSWITTDYPGCKEAGTQMRVCAECKATESKTQAAAGHSTIPLSPSPPAPKRATPPIPAPSAVTAMWIPMWMPPATASAHGRLPPPPPVPPRARNAATATTATTTRFGKSRPRATPRLSTRL